MALTQSALLAVERQAAWDQPHLASPLDGSDAGSDTVKADDSYSVANGIVHRNNEGDYEPEPSSEEWDKRILQSFKTLDDFARYIKAWTSKIINTVRPTFLEEDEKGHHYCDVDMDTGKTLDPVFFPDTCRDETPIEDPKWASHRRTQTAASVSRKYVLKLERQLAAEADTQSMGGGVRLHEHEATGLTKATDSGPNGPTTTAQDLKSGSAPVPAVHSPVTQAEPPVQAAKAVQASPVTQAVPVTQIVPVAQGDPSVQAAAAVQASPTAHTPPAVDASPTVQPVPDAQTVPPVQPTSSAQASPAVQAEVPVVATKTKKLTGRYMRWAEEKDLVGVLNIYNREVIKGTQAPDADVLSPEDIACIWTTCQDHGLPFIVAVEAGEEGEEGEQVIGFAFISDAEPGLSGRGRGSGPLSAKANIYVKISHRQKGLGSAFLDQLLIFSSPNYVSKANTQIAFLDRAPEPVEFRHVFVDVLCGHPAGVAELCYGRVLGKFGFEPATYTSEIYWSSATNCWLGKQTFRFDCHRSTKSTQGGGGESNKKNRAAGTADTDGR